MDHAFLAESLEAAAEAAQVSAKDLTAVQFLGYLENLYVQDPIADFSVIDGELYHASGRVVKTPRYQPDLVMSPSENVAINVFPPTKGPGV